MNPRNNRNQNSFNELTKKTNFDNYNHSQIARRNIKRLDSYYNAMSGFGGQFDPMTRITYNTSAVIDRATIENLFRQDWLSRKIIQTIPDDCLRNGIDIHIQSEELKSEINTKFDSLNVFGKFKEALINARLYGGACIILGIPNQELRTPLDYDKIEDLYFLNVINRHEIEVSSYYKDPFEPNFAEPELYKLNTTLRPDDYDPEKFYIHESRILRFDGEYLPLFLKRLNQGWHDSTLNSINQTLKQYGTAVQSVAMLFQDFISKTLKINNLEELLQSDTGRQALELRLQYAIANFSSLGIILLGENEEFNKTQTPISGLADLLDKHIEIMSAASIIPRSRVFGQSLGTLAGATETTRAYYEYIVAYQKEKLKNNFYRIIKIILNCKSLKTKDKIPKEWTFEFNTLWDATDKEITTARKMQAQVDDLYIRNKTITPEEVARSRFRKEGYNWDTIFDPDNRIGEFYEEANSGFGNEINAVNPLKNNKKKSKKSSQENPAKEE